MAALANAPASFDTNLSCRQKTYAENKIFARISVSRLKCYLFLLYGGGRRSSSAGSMPGSSNFPVLTPWVRAVCHDLLRDQPSENTV